jgi:hypothetical protein
MKERPATRLSAPSCFALGKYISWLHLPRLSICKQGSNDRPLGFAPSYLVLGRYVGVAPSAAELDIQGRDGRRLSCLLLPILYQEGAPGCAFLHWRNEEEGLTCSSLLLLPQSNERQSEFRLRRSEA